MTRKELTEIIKSVLFLDFEDGAFEIITTSDGTEWVVESGNYGDEDREAWYLFVDLFEENDGYDPIHYSREDGTDDEIAEAAVKRLLYDGFKL